MTISLLLVQLAMCAAILWKELVVNKCKRIVSSVFFTFYFLLFIVEPLVIHVFYGGPRSIAQPGVLVADDYVFFVFNMLGIALLLTGWLFSRTTVKAHAIAPGTATISPALLGIKNLLGLMVPIGFWLFYRSTGLSIGELLVASRFAWFESAAYSAVQAVAAAYLIALTPIYFMLYLESRKRTKFDYLVLILVICALLMYGVVTKDRKWVFYLLSGWLASAYLRGGRTVRIGMRGMVSIGVIMVVILLSQILRDLLPQLLMNRDSTAGDGFEKGLSRLFVESDLAYFYNASIEAIHQNVNKGFYIVLGLARRSLFFFLPTSISFGLKVEDMSAIFSDVVGGGDDIRRGNMPPGLFGLFVLSFGFIGSVFMMPALVVFIRFLDNVLLRPVTLVTANILSFVLVGIVFFFRGDESTVIYFPIFNLLVTIAWSVMRRLRLE